jgi:Mrp family chromosome partitioning ATPase
MTPIAGLIADFESMVGGADESSFLSKVRVVYLSPTLHIDLISDAFRGYNDDDRISRISDELVARFGHKADAIPNICARLPVTINALTSDEAKNKESWLANGTTGSWVSWFLDKKPFADQPKKSKATTFIHFYGYKGGQARSSVLALFGKLLADDGFKILAIDADTEAPSLDAMFGVQADRYSQSLMGLCGWAEEFAPIPAAYTGKSGTGRLDVLPCRPRSEQFDLDFALLVATAPLDTRIYEKAAKNLLAQVERDVDPYDLVLIDHRTGIATSVLPLVSELPGPVVVFVRPDSNTISLPSEIKKVVRSIFSSSGGSNGAFVSFSLDSNRKSDASIPSYEARARSELLEELAHAVSASSDKLENGEDSMDSSDEGVSSQELAFNWVDWYLDRALLDPTLPDVTKLQVDNILSLKKLRDVLGLPLQKNTRRVLEKAATNQESTATDKVLSLSGARDAGTFIHIPDVERLFVKGSPITYILGRKGTGKTRLLREVAQRKMGIPILVAADENEFTALKSQSPEAQAWVNATSDPITFWWSLIRLALDGSESLTDAIGAALNNQTNVLDLANPFEIKKHLLTQTDLKVFLVDGLETLVASENIKAYVSGLFVVMNTIQNDSSLSAKLAIRAFLREDLASDSIQNIEQQMEGRVLRLKWSTTSILNFAVSRLPMLPWISQKFPQVIDDIENLRTEVERSALTEQDATEILLRVFPQRLRRNNLLTSTFLRLYFSDAGGDNLNLATFYPRLYLYFLQKLDELAKTDSASITDTNSRLDSALLNQAYDQASTEFIKETQQELVHLLTLEESRTEATKGSAQANVTRFVTAFDGISTPFVLDKLIEDLSVKTKFSEQSIRESLQKMKNLRMFEDRPGFPGYWRVGQLYKMGLRMKYAR